MWIAKTDVSSSPIWREVKIVIKLKGVYWGYNMTMTAVVLMAGGPYSFHQSLPCKHSLCKDSLP